MSESPDGLFETSEPAINSKIERFAKRIAHLTAHQQYECPIERAMMGLTCAVEELDGVLLLARSPEALAELRQCAEDAIGRLIIVSSTALTLAELEGPKS